MEDNIRSSLIFLFSDGSIGKSRAISRSKIRNRIAIRKNRKEKGSRAELMGSNPHSYGDFFFRSNFRFGRKCLIINSRLEIIIDKIKNISSFIFRMEKWQSRNAFDLKSIDEGLNPSFSYDPHQYIQM